MRKFFGVLTVLLLFSGLCLPGKSKVLGEIVATVDGEVITSEEIDQRLNSYLEQAKEDDWATPEDYIKELKRLTLIALKQSIDEKLILKEAKRQGICVSEKEVNDYLKVVKKEFSTEAAFQRRLEECNLSLDAYRKQIEEMLLEKKVIQEEVIAKIATPTNEEIKKIYAEQKENFKTPEGELRSFEQMKEELRNYIFSMRVGEEYRRWIEKLREKASIKEDFEEWWEKRI